MARAPKRSAERCPTHPGAFLREMVLPAISVSKVEIAAALGVSRQTL
jgi:plasmid maintenance system antidote protein VapI